MQQVLKAAAGLASLASLSIGITSAAAHHSVFEMTSPGNLVRAGGWRRDAVKVGDRVEVTFNPLRETDHRGGALKMLVLVDTGAKFINNLLDQEQPGLE